MAPTWQASHMHLGVTWPPPGRCTWGPHGSHSSPFAATHHLILCLALTLTLTPVLTLTFTPALPLLSPPQECNQLAARVCPGSGLSEQLTTLCLVLLALLMSAM